MDNRRGRKNQPISAAILFGFLRVFPPSQLHFVSGRTQELGGDYAKTVSPNAMQADRHHPAYPVQLFCPAYSARPTGGLSDTTCRADAGRRIR